MSDQGGNVVQAHGRAVSISEICLVVASSLILVPTLTIRSPRPVVHIALIPIFPVLLEGELFQSVTERDCIREPIIFLTSKGIGFLVDRQLRAAVDELSRSDAQLHIPRRLAMGFHIGDGCIQVALVEDQIAIQMLNLVLVICHRRPPKDPLTATILLFPRTLNVNVSKNLL